MKFTVLTLFPQLVDGFLSAGLLSAARERGLVAVETLNPRDFTSDAHRTVDDRVFGGGDGMVMKPEPLAAAIDHLRGPIADGGAPLKVVVLSPSGRPWSQSRAREWAAIGGHVALVCGRYAGIDQRFIAKYADEEVSLGDFILNGGEVAALAVIESVVRLVPGVLGNQVSAQADSFSENLLEAPQFTRPREWMGLRVPSTLLSGNHAEIAAFLRAVSLIRTNRARPELLSKTDALELKGAEDLLASLPEDERRALGL